MKKVDEEMSTPIERIKALRLTEEETEDCCKWQCDASYAAYAQFDKVIKGLIEILEEQRGHGTNPPGAEYYRGHVDARTEIADMLREALGEGE